MHPAKLLSTFAIGAILSTLVPLSSGGCGACDEYLECTSRPGLRYVSCGKKQHEFNDGTSFDDKTTAWDFCFCGGLIDCKDGSNLYLCNYMTYDGTVVAYPPDNRELEMTSAVAQCLDYDGCAVETARCNFGGWYLNCSRGTSRVYVSADGKLFASEYAAVNTCVALGQPGQYFSCEEAIADCSELDNCLASVACSDSGFCGSSPSCYRNDTPSSCIADPACRWSP